MKIRFNLNFDSLIALQEDVIEHGHIHFIKKAYFKWISTIIIFIIALLIMKFSLLTVSISAIIAIAFFFIFPVIYNKVAFSRLSKQMERNDYSSVLGECEVTISSSGINRKLHNKETHFEWENFESWREDHSYYFLYVTDLDGLIISKHPDEMNEQEKIAFNEFFKEKLNNQIDNESAN